MIKSNIALLLLTLIVSLTVNAQPKVKRALTPDDFASWNIIKDQQISNNGKYVVYEQNPLKGDGKLFLTKEGKTIIFFNRACKAKLGSNNNVLVFTIKPAVDSVRQAKLNKAKKEDMPPDSVGIFLMKNREIVKYANVKSYKLPKENASWVAFCLKKGKIEEKKQKSGEEKTKSAAEAIEKKEKPKKKKEKQPGDKLVLFNVQSKDTVTLNNVVEYGWAKKGNALLCVQQHKDSVNTFSKLIKFDPDAGTFAVLYETEGWLKKATLDEAGEQCAFLLSKDTVDEKIYDLFFIDGQKPEKIVSPSSQNMPSGWSVSENGKIYFSKDASKLYFGTAVSPKHEPKDTLLDEEKPKLDVWNWKDKKLQPQQKLEAKKEKKRTYLAVYNIDQKNFVQLGDTLIKEVRTLQHGNCNIALGMNTTPYERAFSWTGKGLRDYYLIDVESGEKREILKAKHYVWISPRGKHIIFYELRDSSYYAMSTAEKNPKFVSLTREMPVIFYNEWNDCPQDPRPYGLAGWSPEGKYAYVYDRYDIWQLDPSGKEAPVNITNTYGRNHKIRLRYKKLDKELLHIPADENILLTAFDENTMKAGFFSTKFNRAKNPELLIMDNYMFNFREMKKAKNTDKVLWTKQNVATFPDLCCSNLKFEHTQKLSNANPQQSQFVWPKVEMLEWTSFSGEKLKGLLYKPENMDPEKKYPMIVYFYERNSEYLHQYYTPKPSHSVISKTFYCSNDYLIFVPDITYTTGYPGESAYNAIVSGTKYLLDKYSFINPEKLGLQGQSWGGYQTAFLITQTEMYAAAMAGAPVSNMTSAYGGIRWGSGMSRMFQYEHTQSRIGGTLWEKPLLYIENSPVFYAPKVKTPLLMMHNDNDGAVPWYQGIEMFVALRRLNKPAWLLCYNGEPHNLPTKSWANRMDLTRRMFQFFNHYLKNEPAPEWMEKGIPAVEKGTNLGY